MSSKYNPQKIEQKWQALWPKERESYKLEPGDEPYYALDMFSYPSSEGLHVGHWRPYIIADVWARYQTLLGKKVLHPTGFDAFGLPAENAAIKNHTHPAEYTKKSIANFTRQIEQAGIMYDWSTQVITSDPSYYRWTQWLFLQLYKSGLAYRKSALVNWCPKDQTVLANEQVINGRCERCGTEVTKKELKQWFFKITDFAEELLNFTDINWPDRVRHSQVNWIGKSEGAEILFDVPGQPDPIAVFTTRPDTIMGVTYLVVAPEHPLVAKLTTEQHKETVATYSEAAKKKSEIDRLAEDKKKTGVFTGTYAMHPIAGKNIPIWVADYVIGTYGTGAVMGVPAHDERDFIFANDYNLPIDFVIRPKGEAALDVSKAYIEKGKLFNSGELDGLDSTNWQPIIAKLESTGHGQLKVQYRLRDWLVSRQRYWGAPIPIIYCEKCGEQPVPEDQLPVELPLDVEFTPSGASSLERHPTFKHATCPKCGGSATRETDTLDTFVDSSWYFLRYTSPKDETKAFDYDQVKEWLPVDFYIGGVEHSILHLLYARFVMKALNRLNLVPYDEPFKIFYGNGMIYLHGSKMSKSKGNIVSQEEIVSNYGTDALRGYILFMGPADQDAEWQVSGINGVKRFLEKAWTLLSSVSQKSNSADSQFHPAIQKAYAGLSELLPHFHFNRVISSLMVMINELGNHTLSPNEAETVTQLMAPFFPHIAEEIWQQLGHEMSVFTSRWPNIVVAADQTVTYAIQVNGKLRATLEIEADAPEEEVVSSARKLMNSKGQLVGQEVVKTVFVTGRIVNFVVK